MRFIAKHVAIWLRLKHVHMMRHNMFIYGTKVREKLRNGEALPTKFSRPEVAEVLIKGLQQH